MINPVSPKESKPNSPILETKIRVSIADYKIARGHCSLISYGLGSCLGIALFQPGFSVAGLAHILLPRKKPQHSLNGNPLKYADLALHLMRMDLIFHGASPEFLQSKIAGGANMFYTTQADQKQTMGQRNLQAVLEVLNELNIPVVAQDTGGNYGRTVIFHPAKGELIIRSLRGGEKVL